MTKPTEPKPESAEPALTPGDVTELVEALVSAYRPEALAPDLNHSLIEAALEDPLRAPSERELIESERFRRALAGDVEHPDLELARALGAAHRAGATGNPELDVAHARMLNNALGATDVRPRNVVYLVFGVATSLAAAAAILLVLAFPSSESPSVAAQASTPPPLVQSRSSDPMFEGRFADTSTTSRVDRIATLRARELRNNRFRQWGVDSP